MNPALNVTMIPAKYKDAAVSATGKVLRVAAYCRVSTDENNQKNSYENQVGYYYEYINSNPDWKLVKIYADEGISGTQVENRVQFKKMIRDAKNGKIDLILCKSISRLSRNTVNFLDCIRELRALNVDVYFEKENIHTISMSSEFILSLYASFAQAESESISKNVTWCISKGFREGKVQYKFNKMLGYRLDKDGKPYIVEEEAEIVRYIFKEYAAGETSKNIAKALTEMGAKNRNGSVNWTRYQVYQVLKNEKYVGDALLQKTITVDCLTHKRRKNNGEKNQYYVSDCHEAIIDRRTYDIAKFELQKRKRKCKAKTKKSAKPDVRSTKYCLSRLMVCPYCGNTYKRVIWHEKAGKVGVWRCKSRFGDKKCPKSSSYHEDLLQNAILAAVNEFIKKAGDMSIASPKSLTDDIEANERRIKEIHDELIKIETERESILSGIDGIGFDSMSDRLNELNRLGSEYADQLIEIKRKQDEYRRNSLREENAKKLLKDMKPLESFDQKTIEKIISRVEAISKKEIKITFFGGCTVSQEIRKN